MQLRLLPRCWAKFSRIGIIAPDRLSEFHTGKELSEFHTGKDAIDGTIQVLSAIPDPYVYRNGPYGRVTEIRGDKVITNQWVIFGRDWASQMFYSHLRMAQTHHDALRIANHTLGTEWKHVHFALFCFDVQSESVRTPTAQDLGANCHFVEGGFTSGSVREAICEMDGSENAQVVYSTRNQFPVQILNSDVYFKQK